jgi:hypothetical protein
LSSPRDPRAVLIRESACLSDISTSPCASATPLRPKVLRPSRIKPQEDEQQYRESPQRTASVTEERQWNAYHRHHPDGHPDIYKEVDQEQPEDAVTVCPHKGGPLSLRHHQQPEQKPDKQSYYHCRTDESPLFPDCAEDKVGALFGDELEFGLGTVQVSLPGESAGSY